MVLSKNQVKFLNSLNLHKFRKLHQQFIAEGSKIVLEFITGSFEVVEVYAQNEWIEENTKLLKEKKITVFEVSQNDLQKVSALSTANVVFAVVKMPARKPENEKLFENLVLVLDDIRDPGNLGTIIRTADWFGIKNIVCSVESVDVYNPKVVKATMGSLSRVEVSYTNLVDFLKKTPKGITIYGTLLEGEKIQSKKLADKGVIIIGNESKGISDKLLPYINEKLYIPSFSSSQAESLNASVATAIVCYEFRRKF